MRCRCSSPSSSSPHVSGGQARPASLRLAGIELAPCSRLEGTEKGSSLIQSHEQRQVYCVGVDLAIGGGGVPSLAGFEPGTTGFRTAHCATTVPWRWLAGACRPSSQASSSAPQLAPCLRRPRGKRGRPGVARRPRPASSPLHVSDGQARPASLRLAGVELALSPRPLAGTAGLARRRRARRLSSLLVSGGPGQVRPA